MLIVLGIGHLVLLIYFFNFKIFPNHSPWRLFGGILIEWALKRTAYLT